MIDTRAALHLVSREEALTSRRAVDDGPEAAPNPLADNVRFVLDQVINADGVFPESICIEGDDRDVLLTALHRVAMGRRIVTPAEGDPLAHFTAHDQVLAWLMLHPRVAQERAAALEAIPRVSMTEALDNIKGLQRQGSLAVAAELLEEATSKQHALRLPHRPKRKVCTKSSTQSHPSFRSIGVYRVVAPAKLVDA